MSERTAWTICSNNAWWSAFGKPARAKSHRLGPPVHDYLAQRAFTMMATGPNQVWLTDVTEHKTAEGKLYVCAMKDAWSGRIVGYSIDSRMKSRLAVNALHNARHGPRRPGRSWAGASSTRTVDRNSGRGNSWPFYVATGCAGAWAAWPRALTTQPSKASGPCCRRTSSTAASGAPERNCGPRSQPGSIGPTTAVVGKSASDVDPHRVRDHHDHPDRDRGLTTPTVTYSCSSPQVHDMIN